MDSLFTFWEILKIQFWLVAHLETTSKVRWSCQFQKQSVVISKNSWLENAFLAQLDQFSKMDNANTALKINTSLKTKKITSLQNV